MDIIKKILSTLGLGIILQWLSLFLSYMRMPGPIEMTDTYATGGFPLKIFEYPVPPMGNDYPPPEAWPLFFLNLSIWIIISLLIIFMLKKDLSWRVTAIIIFLACVFTLFGLIYLGLRFD